MPKGEKLQIVSEAEFKELLALLLKEQTLTFKIASGSMEPLIMTGKLIDVAPLDETPRRFDILVFWNGKILICHYLWHINISDKREKRVFVTRSLKGEGDDLPFFEDVVLGRVTNFRLSSFSRLKIFLRALFRH